ncbi:hypothetical protein TNCV_1426431 [Trichonephila clavipes]|nr:hypothetical protein TNCV_1426431 [Trichonephila clavipes]
MRSCVILLKVDVSDDLKIGHSHWPGDLRNVTMANQIADDANDNIVVESVPEPDKIGNLSEEVVDLAWQISLEVDSDDEQELLGFYNEELKMDELIEMHGQEQDIQELESLDRFQSEDRLMVGNFTESLNLIDNGLYKF